MPVPKDSKPEQPDKLEKGSSDLDPDLDEDLSSTGVLGEDLDIEDIDLRWPVKTPIQSS